MYAELEGVLDEAYDELAALRAADTGRCDGCQVATINGVRCHEQGCWRERRIRHLQERIDRLEDY